MMAFGGAQLNRIFAYQSKKCALGLFLALVALSSFAPRSNAQASASISGYVTDQSGAPVVSAAVAVKNLETGAIRTTKANANGNYLVLSLPTGAYEVVVGLQGFQNSRMPKLNLSVDQEARLDVTLYVAAANIDIEVKSDTAVVNTSAAEISGLVGEQQIKDLPL